MNQIPHTIPKWVIIISVVISIMEIMVCIMLFVSPQEMLETVDLNAKGVNYIVQMWAVRQFALGVIFGFAVINKSSQMLLLSYIFLLVMFLGDGTIGVLQKENSLVIMAAVMSLFSGAMIFKLNKNKE